MRPKNREVNIFNLSMLDVMTGALGAVLIIMSALSMRPDIDPDRLISPEEHERVKRENERLREENRKLKIRRPVAVQIWWTTPDQDIDLYVKSASPRDPGPDISKKQGTIFPGDIGNDAKGGYRSEVWLMRDMPAGTYEVFAKMMGPAEKRRRTEVLLYALYRRKGYPLAKVVLRPDDRLRKAADLVIAPDGSLEVRLAPGAQAY